MSARTIEELGNEAGLNTVGRFLNAWLNVCVSGKKGKLRV